MTLNEYQEKADTTCLQESRNFAYMFLNLVAEIGEFAGKVAKAIRKGNITIDENDVEPSDKFIENGLDEFLAELKQENGDIYWQTVMLSKIFGWTAEEVTQLNLDKLSSRQKRNVIDGNGDNR